MVHIPSQEQVKVQTHFQFSPSPKLQFTKYRTTTSQFHAHEVPSPISVSIFCLIGFLFFADCGGFAFFNFFLFNLSYSFPHTAVTFTQLLKKQVCEWCPSISTHHQNIKHNSIHKINYQIHKLNILKFKSNPTHYFR